MAHHPMVVRAGVDRAMSDPICKNCKHPESAHDENLFGTCCSHRDWWEREVCRCKGFVPVQEVTSERISGRAH